MSPASEMKGLNLNYSFQMRRIAALRQPEEDWGLLGSQPLSKNIRKRQYHFENTKKLQYVNH